MPALWEIFVLSILVICIVNIGNLYCQYCLCIVNIGNKNINIALHIVNAGNKMTETAVRVGASGRAQIPYDVRMRLGISDGDQLIIEIEKIIHADGNKGVLEDAGHLKSGVAINEFLKDESEQTIH